MNTPKPMNDGGPAFPQTPILNFNNEVVTAGMYFAEAPGMSLRDWFAGMAMQKIIDMDTAVEAANQGESKLYFPFCASAAYQAADAMLAARNNQPTPQ